MHVSATPPVPMPTLRRWLRPRLPAVEQLRLGINADLAGVGPIQLPEALLAGSGSALPHLPHQPLPLTVLSLGWRGVVHFTPRSLAQLPALRTLAFWDTHLRVTEPLPAPTEGGQPLPPLTNFALDGGSLRIQREAIDAAWLPSTVTSLKLCQCGLYGLRGTLLGVPHLKW